MKFNVNFSEVDSPTGPQIDLVQKMCDKLNYPKPGYTFEEYNDFISDNIEEFEWVLREEAEVIREFFEDF